MMDGKEASTSSNTIQQEGEGSTQPPGFGSCTRTGVFFARALCAETRIYIKILASIPDFACTMKSSTQIYLRCVPSSSRCIGTEMLSP